jgi:hypothetical protein
VLLLQTDHRLARRAERHPTMNDGIFTLHTPTSHVLAFVLREAFNPLTDIPTVIPLFASSVLSRDSWAESIAAIKRAVVTPWCSTIHTNRHRAPWLLVKLDLWLDVTSYPRRRRQHRQSYSSGYPAPKRRRSFERFLSSGSGEQGVGASIMFDPLR